MLPARSDVLSSATEVGGGMGSFLLSPTEPVVATDSPAATVAADPSTGCERELRADCMGRENTECSSTLSNLLDGARGVPPAAESARSLHTVEAEGEDEEGENPTGWGVLYLLKGDDAVRAPTLL